MVVRCRSVQSLKYTPTSRRPHPSELIATTVYRGRLPGEKLTYITTRDFGVRASSASLPMLTGSTPTHLHLQELRSYDVLAAKIQT